MNLLRLSLAALAVIGAGAAFAGNFVAKPGVQEFSGEMIVRPVPASTWISQGVAAEAAISRTNRAFARLASFVAEDVKATGELVIRVPSGKTENSFNRELMATGDYQYAIPNWRLAPLAAPNDPSFAQQWHHSTMRSARGWDFHTGGPSVTIGIVDSGVKIDHVDLAASVVPGYNSEDGRRQVDGGSVTDVNGHGTHVAGCAAAIGNNAVGVAGMGWRMRIMPVRATNEASGLATLSALLGGARWAADNGAKVVNVSYGGVQAPPTQETGAYIRSRGSVLLFAAGNSGEVWDSFDHPDVVVVTASSRSDGWANWSASGRAIDFAAPGEGILSTTSDGAYQPFDGTSMSSPLVAGLFGLVFSYNPRLTTFQAEAILARAAAKIAPENRIGHGRIDVLNTMIETQKTLSVRSDVAGSAIALSMGALTGGNLSSVLAVDSNNYVVRSSRFGLGQGAAAIVDFTLPNASRIVGVTPSAIMTSTRTSTPVTGTMFLWNFTARRWDASGSASVATTGSKAVSREFSRAGFANYMSPTGAVRLMVRGHTADTRVTGTAESFSLNVNRVWLGIESLVN